MVSPRALLILFFLASALALSWLPPAAGRADPKADEAFHFPAGRLGTKAELKYVNGLPVLVVGGTPEEMGTAVGALAVKTGPRALDYPRDLLRAFRVEHLYGALQRMGSGMVK